jgi:DNA-binding transcriptional regulator YbjK
MGETARRQSAQRRRDALLRAAVDIAAESGAAAATHRSIAARADVPLATTSYFFESIADLMTEAMRTFADARVAELDSVNAAMTGSATAEDIAAGFAALLANADRTTSLAQIEAYLSAARAPAMRGAVAAALEAFERVAAAALRAAGARRPEDGARAFVALADGFGLQHLACPREGDEEALREALRALYIAYAMDDAERAEWDARMRR